VAILPGRLQGGGGLHQPRAGRGGAHDGGHADEEHPAGVPPRDHLRPLQALPGSLMRGGWGWWGGVELEWGLCGWGEGGMCGGGGVKLMLDRLA